MIRVEVVSLGLALHLLGLVHLGVITAAQGLQLAEDVVKAGQRIVGFIRLWQMSVKRTHARKGNIVPSLRRGL